MNDVARVTTRGTGTACLTAMHATLDELETYVRRCPDHAQVLKSVLAEFAKMVRGTSMEEVERKRLSEKVLDLGDTLFTDGTLTGGDGFDMLIELKRRHGFETLLIERMERAASGKNEGGKRAQRCVLNWLFNLAGRIGTTKLTETAISCASKVDVGNPETDVLANTLVRFFGDAVIEKIHPRKTGNVGASVGVANPA